MTPETQKKLIDLAELCRRIIEAVEATGNRGLSGDTICAAVMGGGCLLEDYNCTMEFLFRERALRRSGNFYYIRKRA